MSFGGSLFNGEMFSNVRKHAEKIADNKFVDVFCFMGFFGKAGRRRRLNFGPGGRRRGWALPDFLEGKCVLKTSLKILPVLAHEFTAFFAAKLGKTKDVRLCFFRGGKKC
jgi:hypothetical protein